MRSKKNMLETNQKLASAISKTFLFRSHFVQQLWWEQEIHKKLAGNFSIVNFSWRQELSCKHIIPNSKTRCFILLKNLNSQRLHRPHITSRLSSKPQPWHPTDSSSHQGLNRPPPKIPPINLSLSSADTLPIWFYNDSNVQHCLMWGTGHWIDLTINLPIQMIREPLSQSNSMTTTSR